jgi:protein phosphatase 2C family protein 2/3
MMKNYNEDRVSIIMNISKPNYKGRWPKCSYFAVFDGHGGSMCSDFLKDNMHKYVIYC